VLLVLPLLVMFGVATLVGVVADAGLQDETGRLFLAAFVVWVVLAVAAVLGIVAYLNRRTRA
jgi:hypothetical protein